MQGWQGMLSTSMGSARRSDSTSPSSSEPLQQQAAIWLCAIAMMLFQWEQATQLTGLGYTLALARRSIMIFQNNTVQQTLV